MELLDSVQRWQPLFSSLPGVLPSISSWLRKDFGALEEGRKHYQWVLRIVRELYNYRKLRGHTLSPWQQPGSVACFLVRVPLVFNTLEWSCCCAFQVELVSSLWAQDVLQSVREHAGCSPRSSWYSIDQPQSLLAPDEKWEGWQGVLSGVRSRVLFIVLFHRVPSFISSPVCVWSGAGAWHLKYQMILSVQSLLQPVAFRT